jgi:hypothetical protein
MDAKEIDAKVKRWCLLQETIYSKGYSQDRVETEMSLIYDDEDVVINRLKDEERITISVCPPPIYEGDPQIKQIGFVQWKNWLKALVFQSGKVDIEFLEQDPEEDGMSLYQYFLVDHIYDDSFSVDELHRRIRAIVAIQKTIEHKINSSI